MLLMDVSICFAAFPSDCPRRFDLVFVTVTGVIAYLYLGLPSPNAFTETSKKKKLLGSVVNGPFALA